MKKTKSNIEKLELIEFGRAYADGIVGKTIEMQKKINEIIEYLNQTPNGSKGTTPRKSRI